MKNAKFYSVKFDVLGKPERKIDIPCICRDTIMVMNIFVLLSSLLQPASIVLATATLSNNLFMSGVPLVIDIIIIGDTLCAVRITFG